MAEDVAMAKKLAKENPEYKSRKMHIDSLMEIQSVDGYKIIPTKGLTQEDKIIYWNEG